MVLSMFPDLGDETDSVLKSIRTSFTVHSLWMSTLHGTPTVPSGRSRSPPERRLGVVYVKVKKDGTLKGDIVKHLRSICRHRRRSRAA